MVKRVDLDMIGAIRTLPEAGDTLKALMAYAPSDALVKSLTKDYVVQPNGNASVEDMALVNPGLLTDKVNADFLHLSTMTQAYKALGQLRTHVRDKLPTFSSHGDLSNEGLTESIGKALLVTRKRIIDLSAVCYSNLLDNDVASHQSIHLTVHRYLQQHFPNVYLDGCLDRLLAGGTKTRMVTYYQVDFPAESSGNHVFPRVFLVLTFVLETQQAFINMLPHHRLPGTFHPGDVLNNSAIGASVVHQLSRYDLV